MSETINFGIFIFLFLSVFGLVFAITVQMMDKKQEKAIKTRKKGKFTVIDGGKSFYKE